MLKAIRDGLARCALLVAVGGHAQTPAEPWGRDRIVTRELDPAVPIVVKTMPTVTTTVEFPQPVDALDGKGMVVDEAKDLGRFQIGWQQGSRFVSVQPLVAEGMLNVNVITGGKVYVMLLAVDVQFDFVVRLVPQGSLALVENLLKQQRLQTQAKVMPDQPATPEPMTPAKAISLFDQCILFPLLEASKPEAVKGIYHRYGVGTVSSYRPFDVQLLAVFRQEALDAVVFHVRFSAKQAVAYYDPQGFGVRVGSDYYAQYTSKASGKVVAHPDDPRENEAWFMVVGAGQGQQRNNLAVTNTFLVNVAPIAPVAEGGQTYRSYRQEGEGKQTINPKEHS